MKNWAAWGRGVAIGIRREPGGRWALTIDGAPRYCHALRMAPEGIEPELTRGLWLVLTMAVWSGPDRQAVQVAVNATRAFANALQLGVRPFDDYEEISAWCPAVKEKLVSPLWLLLRDGELIAELRGLPRLAQVQEMIRQGLPD